ncbi:MAG TPA: 1,4-dihydroxy-2-naphthoate octaprenyltransferase [Nitrospiria bacterium]|nr:1,4-dihydroxy-2-naphthoate octaprenyltransferase [Nitrospiria bacterium]
MKQIGLWVRAMRLPFLQASLIPAALGSALAYRNGTFSWGLFVGIMAGIGAINIATNLSNDYFDHRSGADERNRQPTPFSGGSRVIQEGRIPSETVFVAAMISYAVAVVIGLFLTVQSGWTLLWFGVPGVVLSYFYTAPPLKLGYRGWGEFLVGVLLGPLAVMGSYYVYSRALTPQAFLLSLPVGFLVAGILYINEFPDADSDAASGKRHWIVRVGRKKAVKGYFAILGAAYLSLLLSGWPGPLPAWTLLALASLPIAVQAGRILYRSYDQSQRLIPAMGLTIGAHLAVGLLQIVGLLLDAWRGHA